MARSLLDDPLKNYKYRIEIDGFQRAGFSECSGLEVAIEAVEYREGGDPKTPRKSPGQASFPNITLKRGVIAKSTEGGDFDMEGWMEQCYEHNSVVEDTEPRRTIDIVIMRPDNQEGRRYRLDETFPVNYQPFGDLNATANDNVIEELEVAYEGFNRVAAGT